MDDNINVGNMALSGIAGGLQGAVQGAQTGVNMAAGMQNIENSRQEMDIRQTMLKRAQAEEAKSNMPVYKEDVAKRVPREMQESWNAKTQGQWQKGADGREFMPKRDLDEYKETLNNFDKHEMVAKGIEFLAKENQGLEPQYKKNTDTLKDLAKEFATKSEKLKADGETSKLLKLQADWKERLTSGDIGELTKQTQEQQKKIKENQTKIGNYQGKLNGAEEAVKKVVEKYPGVNPDDVTLLWGGDKPNDPEWHQNYVEAQQRVQEVMQAEADLKKKDTPDKRQIIEIPSEDGKTAQKYNVDLTTGEKTPIGNKYAVKSQVTNINMPQQGGFNKMSDDKKDFWYQQYAQNKTLPPFAYRDSESRNAFASGFAEYAKQQGLNGVDVSTKQLLTKAQGMALNQVQKMDTAQGIFINKIDENTKTLARIKEKYKVNYDRWANVPLNKVQEFVGSGDLAAIKLAAKSLSNEVAKVESGSLGIQEVSVEQARYMEKVHDVNLSFAEIMKVANMGIELGKNARVATKKERQSLLDEMKTKKDENKQGDPLGIR